MGKLNQMEPRYGLFQRLAHRNVLSCPLLSSAVPRASMPASVRVRGAASRCSRVHAFFPSSLLPWRPQEARPPANPAGDPRPRAQHLVAQVRQAAIWTERTDGTERLERTDERTNGTECSKRHLLRLVPSTAPRDSIWPRPACTERAPAVTFALLIPGWRCPDEV